MCGISGIIPLSKDITKAKILEVMKHLLLENRTRGGDSTGIASWDMTNNKILVCKQAEEAKDFITNLTEEHILGATIGHNRAQTRGPADDPENNHPMFGEKFCLVHNGMVHTMKELPDYTYKGKCDTEVLLSYIERFGMKAAIPQIDGSAAVAVMSPEDKMFYLYRHTSPIVLTYFPGKAFVFSSTEYPLKKIGAMLGAEKMWNIFPTQVIADFDEGQFFALNMETHQVSTEVIKVESKPVNYGTCDYYNKQVKNGYNVYD